MAIGTLINQAELLTLTRNNDNNPPPYATVTDPHFIGFYFILEGRANLVMRVQQVCTKLDVEPRIATVEVPIALPHLSHVSQHNLANVKLKDYSVHFPSTVQFDYVRYTDFPIRIVLQDESR